MLDILRSQSNGNGLDSVNGRGLERRKLTLAQRLDLAADVVSGRRHLHPSIKATAALLKITPVQVSARLKARAQQEAEWLRAERRRRVQEEAEAVNAEADSIVREWRLSSSEAREVAVQMIGPAAVWDSIARVIA